MAPTLDSSGTHPFVYTSGTYTDVAFPGATSTTASAINNAGQVAGSYFDGTSNHTFLDTDGTYVRIDAPLSAGEPANTYFTQLDNTGDVLGGYYGPTGSGSFLYSDGTARDVGIPGVQSSTMIGMNNLGDLIGSFYDGTQTRDFLASPVQGGTTASNWLPQSQSALPGGAGAGMSDAEAAGLSPPFHQS